MSVQVLMADPDPSGLAMVLTGLLEQNLVRDPARARLLRPSLVSIAARDAGVTVTLHLRPGRVVARDGADPRALLAIAADSDRLMALIAVPLRLGLPDPMTATGRGLMRDVVMRRIRIGGLLHHPVRLARLTALLSVR